VTRNGGDARRRDVFGREHRQNLFHGARRLRVHRHDARMRVRRSHKGGVRLIGQTGIVGELPGAADEGIVFNAGFFAGSQNDVHWDSN
jgi:hypothetical protein